MQRTKLKVPKWPMRLWKAITVEVVVDVLPDGEVDWDPLHDQRSKVEECAKRLSYSISVCETLEESYKLLDRIAGMRRVYGPTTQVCGAISSLHLELYHKQDKIINRIYGGRSASSRW